MRLVARQVIGGDDSEVMDRVEALVGTPGTPVVRTDWASAELIKYGSNSFLALKISYANELARFADVVGGDIMHVVRSMGLDPRIGMDGMRPGLGFAGCCVPPSDNFRYRSPTAKACGNEHRPYQNRQVAIGPGKPARQSPF
jgi:UDPglucose 6-dehydrogenase